MNKTIERRAIEWAAGSRGASAKCIWATMMEVDQQGAFTGSFPSDSGDFGRCYDLLELIPEWRDRINEMADVNKYWAALSVNWEQLEAQYLQNKEILYKSLKAILEPIEDADPSIVRFGSGLTMRVGKL